MERNGVMESSGVMERGGVMDARHGVGKVGEWVGSGWGW